jgi:hypothetical protein
MCPSSLRYDATEPVIWRMASWKDNRNGIVVLSPARNPWPGKSGGCHSEKIGGNDLG